jgi:cobalt/nickel transport system permease protein
MGDHRGLAFVCVHPGPVPVLTVGAALILVACTGMYRLGAGLERLGVPQLFVTQLLFLYRYLFVVADEGSRMVRSVRLRSAGAEGLSLRVYGSLVGHLLLRSMDRAERVHRAMVARGFDGEVRTLEPGRFRGRTRCLSRAGSPSSRWRGCGTSRS